MKKQIAIVLSCLLFSFSFLNAQTSGKGSWYRTLTNATSAYTYTVRYYKSPEGYATQYHTSFPRMTVTAIHNSSSKTITITVEETGGGVLSDQNEEKVTYETPSLTPFGIGGNYRMLGGTKIPNQVAVKFISTKYDYVNVISVLGRNYSDGAEFFSF